MCMHGNTYIIASVQSGKYVNKVLWQSHLVGIPNKEITPMGFLGQCTPYQANHLLWMRAMTSIVSY